MAGMTGELTGIIGVPSTGNLSGTASLHSNSLSGTIKSSSMNGSIIETFLRGLSAYELAVKHGYVGTEDEWVRSLKADTVVLRNNNDMIQWKYAEEPDTEWRDLIDLNVGRNVRYNTTAYWNAQPDLVSESSIIYVYTDYKTTQDEHGNITYVPGIKVGDGNAYLIDLPFVIGNDSELMTHVLDSEAHVTQAEREFWNNKVRPIISDSDQEKLILTIF